jgi:HEAT repeat protein
VTDEVTPPSAGGPAAEAGPERQTTPFLVLQFFIFPMAIVAVCVAVFVIFGMIAAEGKGARDYLTEVRTGSANRRWQAAFELSKVLQARKDPALADPAFADELAAVFQQSAGDDPRVRRYLALALGRLGSARAIPALLEAVTAKADAAVADSETQIYAIWALGAIADPKALPGLLALTRAEDPGVRKAAVHAIGAFADEASHQALAAALADPAEDVRWNAALALARRRDARAAPVLLQMMDRAHLATIADLTPDQREDAVEQAAAAAASVDDPALRRALEALRDNDPSPKVKEAARRALTPQS